MKALMLISAVLVTSAFVVAPDLVVLDTRRADGPPPARFSHWQHDEVRCYGCHPAVFPQRVPITHERMRAGFACGACHEFRPGVTKRRRSRAPMATTMKCGTCHVR